VQGILAGTPPVTATPTVSPTPPITATPTLTGTPTISPTAATANGDITAFIDSGNPIAGNTALSTDNHSVTDLSNNIYGSNGSPDVAYTFTVTQPQGERVHFQLTPGSGFYYPILYLLGPNNTTTLSDLSTCYYNDPVNLTTGLLAPGTYTVVVDEYYPGDTAGSGPFSLIVSTFHPNCVLNPTTTPVPAVTPGVDDEAFTDAGSLGNVSPGSDLVGAGLVKDNLGDVNTWHFHVTAAGQYSIAADCYDDGTGKALVALDLYQANGSGGFQLVDVTADTSYPNGFSDWLIPGDYYVAAYAEICGSDDSYHLVIQGTLAPTPTPEAAQDITSNINGGEILGDTTGQLDAHSDLDIEGNNWGRGAPDLVYQFTLNQPQQLDIEFGANGGNNSFVAYLRTKQDDPSTTLALAQAVNEEDDASVKPAKHSLSHASPSSEFGSTDLITPLLKPGTYYLIMDGSTPSDYGPFFIDLSTFTPNCGYIGSSAPVQAVQPNISGDATLSPDQADALGTVSSGSTVVGLGSVQYYVGAQHGWSFHAGSDGALYNISLDCYDNGDELDNIGFDLYQAVTIEGVVTLNFLDSTSDNSYPDGTSDILPAGDYYVAVFSNDNGSDGEYRLIVQGGALPTPTATPTITPTPVAPLASFNAMGGVGGLAVNSAGTTVYASFNFEASTLNTDSAYIQTWVGSGNVYSSSATVTGGNCPRGLAVEPSGSYVFAADSCNEYGIDMLLPSGVFLEYMGEPNPNDYSDPGYLFAPTGIAVAGSTIFTAGNVTAYGIQSFTTGGTPVTAWGGPGLDPAIAANSAGTTIFVSNGSTILLYDPTGNSLGTWGADAPSFSTGGLAVAPTGSTNAGYLYVTDRSNNQVLEFNASGTYVGQWGSYGTVPGEFETPSGIAVDGTGNVYVADWGDGRVQKFSAP
jgi:hypothetical protein